MSAYDSRAAVKSIAAVMGGILTLLCLWLSPAAGQAAGAHGGRAPLSGADGALVRTVRVGQHPVLVAVDARDRHVFVANAGPLAGDFVLPRGPGSVSMVDERTGAVLRTVTVGQSPVAIAFDAPTRRVFVLSAGTISTAAGPAGSGGSIAVLDAATGAPLRTIEVDPVPVALSGAGAVLDARQALVVDSASGRVYVVITSGVLALDGSTGRVRRRIVLGGQPSVAALDAAGGRLYVGGGYDPTIPTDPSPTGGTTQGFLAVVDLASGRVRANVALAQQGVGAIAVDGQAGRILVVEPRGASQSVIVDVLDTHAGARPRTITLPSAVGGGDCALTLDRARGRAFLVYTPNGYEAGHGFGAMLYVLDTVSGRVLQTVPLTSDTSSTSGGAGYFMGRAVALVGRPARVLVATARGALSEPPGSVAVYSSDISVFDTPSGRFLTKLPVGMGPQDVAIDEIAWRVFVTNEHDNTLSVFDATRL